MSVDNFDTKKVEVRVAGEEEKITVEIKSNEKEPVEVRRIPHYFRDRWGNCHLDYYDVEYYYEDEEGELYCGKTEMESDPMFDHWCDMMDMANW